MTKCESMHLIGSFVVILIIAQLWCGREAQRHGQRAWPRIEWGSLRCSHDLLEERYARGEINHKAHCPYYFLLFSNVGNSP